MPILGIIDSGKSGHLFPTGAVFKFDSPTGSSTWTSSVNTYSLSLSNCTYSSSNGGYLTFNGTNAKGDSAQSLTMTSETTGWTYAYWLYPTTLSGTGYDSMRPWHSMGIDSTSGNGSFLTGAYSNGTATINGYNQSGADSSTGAITTNAWQLVVASASTTQINWYVNNVAKGTVASPISSKTNNFYVGYSKTLNSNYYAGRMAGMYAWNRQLTVGELSNLYSSTKGNFGL